MEKVNNPLIIRKDDYLLLQACLQGALGRTTFDRVNAEALRAELKKAKLVSKKEFPADVIRLYSTVRIKAGDNDKIIQLILVTPDKADIKGNRISIMSPIGTALIGFRKGQTVNWQVPGGDKNFTILDVINNQ